MSGTKIIFLDIDGVLNCSRTPNPRKFPYIIDPALLDLFKQVVQRSAADVVLSSTWRYDPAGLFSAKRWGVPFVDITPDLPGRARCEEILAWIENRPHVSRFAVLDDEDDQLDPLPLFQPSSRAGLTPEIAAGLEAYLAGRTERDMRRPTLSRLLQNMAGTLKGHKG